MGKSNKFLIAIAYPYDHYSNILVDIDSSLTDAKLCLPYFALPLMFFLKALFNA